MQLRAAAAEFPAVGSVLDASALVTSLGDVRAAEEAAVTSGEEYLGARTHSPETKPTWRARRATRHAHPVHCGRDKAGNEPDAIADELGSRDRRDDEAARETLIADLLARRAHACASRLAASVACRRNDRASRAFDLRRTAAWERDSFGASSADGNASLWRGAAGEVPIAMTAGSPCRLRCTARPKATVPVIPQSAIIRWHGSAWVYENAGNHFIRRESSPRVAVRRALGGAAGTRKDARIVSVGARALLAAELSAASANDDSGG